MTMTFQKAYDEFHERIRYYLGQLVGEDEAEDLTQEVFMKVHKGLETFKEESSLSTWIYRIATNAGLDRLHSAWNRRINHDVSICDETDTSVMALEDPCCSTSWEKQSAPRQIIKSEMTACVREFVEKLPPDYRAVLVLSELKDMKNKEISQILGISLASVKIRLHRARAHLKKEFEIGCELYHDESGLACDRKGAESCQDK